MSSWDDPDPLRTRIRVDSRSTEEWIAAITPTIPPCSECDAAMEPDPGEGGEGDNDYGYEESTYFVCTGRARYPDDDAGDEAFCAAHPRTNGALEVSRYLALNRWVVERFGPNPSPEDLAGA